MAINLTPPSEAKRDEILGELPEEKSRLLTAQNAIQNQIDDLAETTQLNTEYWEYLNDDIIRRYEEESKHMDGVFIEFPVLISDVLAAGQLTGRLHDVTQYEVLRIDEFDFGGTVTGFSPRENTFPSRDDRALDWLRNGFNDGPDTGASTLTAITDSSTGVSLSDDTNVVIGRRYFISGNNSAVVRVNSIAGVSGMGGTTYDVGFDFIQIDDVIFNTSGLGISIGAGFLGSRVFDNTERTNQTAASSGDQNTLLKSFKLLTDSLSGRLTPMNSQLSEINQNLDPQIDNAYTSELQQSISDISAFLSSPDYSNTGLNNIETILNNRDTNFNQRLSYIPNQLSGSIVPILQGTNSYYNLRYQTANFISDKAVGSYTRQYHAGISSDILGKFDDNIDAVSGVYLSL